MGSKNESCYKCPDRTPDCHSICEKYKKYREELEAKKKLIADYKSRHKEHDSYKADLFAKKAKKNKKL